MTGNIGGLYSKVGNRYEALWLVLKLVEVLGGHGKSLKVEGIGGAFAGFEGCLELDDCSEWYQTKINGAGANWTRRALAREGVTAAFKRRLEASAVDRCVFISQDPVKTLRKVPEKALRANDAIEFDQDLNKDEREAVGELGKEWGIAPETTWQWLRRCRFEAVSESSIERNLSVLSDWYFEGSDDAFAVLREYIEQRFNKTITTENIRCDFRDHKKLRLKPAQLDATVRERIASETDNYLKTYIPFGAGGGVIPRKEIEVVQRLLSSPTGRSILLLTGVAGSGKSGVVRGVIDALRQAGIGLLAFRVDQHLTCRTSKELGAALTERNESPAVTLAKLNPQSMSVLVIDQVDAISEISGRNGEVRQTILRLLDEAHNLKTVRVLLVCRTFDLDNDAQLKSLKQAAQVREFSVPLLSWKDDVEAFLQGRGYDVVTLTTAQRDLLCLPLNLALFVEGSDGDQTFSSRTDLFDRLMRKKERAIANGRSLGWTAATALGSLVRWMSERQRLDAPAAVLGAFASASDILASEHLIVNARENLNLFHESFFDYLFARQFMLEALSLKTMLTSTEQHLFRRTQTRQILEVLRSTDRPRYLRELNDVLTNGGIRYHIKNAIALWLGTLADPTVDEFAIIGKLDTPHEALPLLVHDAILSGAGWFDLLNSGSWISEQLSGTLDQRRNLILHWLGKVATERPVEVARLLEAWWAGDAERGQQLLNWFRFVSSSKNDRPLLTLCERVIRATATDGKAGLLGKSSLLFPNWVAERGDDGIVILCALFDAWFEGHPAHHPFERDLVRELDDHWLGEVAKASPRVFIEGAGPALVRSLALIVERQGKSPVDYTFHDAPRAGDRFGADAIFALYRSALRKLAATDPAEARRLLALFAPSLHNLMRHLHLEAVAASGGTLAAHLMELLAVPDLAEAGWSGAKWKSLADAARASLPRLSPQDQQRLETYILDLHPEITAAREMAKDIKEQGEGDWRNRRNVMWWLSRSGHARWCILKTIGAGLLSERGRAVLALGDRKFRGEEPPCAREISGGLVHSPIARERAALMSDQHWLGAIETYDSGRKQNRRHLLDGGPSQLAGELQNLVKSNPGRFINLMERIPKAANPTYIEHILWGLAEIDDPDLALLELAVVRAHARSESQFGPAIVRLFERHPKLANSKVMLDLLFWYAEQGEAGVHETSTSGPAKEEIVTIDDLLNKGMSLHVRGINGCRGAALEAIGQVLWQNPDCADRAWALLEERLEKECLVGVRCCMADPLTPLFNHDRERCAALFERLARSPGADESGDPNSDDDIAPWITHDATRLMPFIVRQVPDVGRRIVDRLLASRNDTFRLIGAWHAIGASFSIESYTSLADALIEGDAPVRRLAAATAANVIERQEFRSRAEEWLRRFFNDCDKHVRTQAAEVFRSMEADEFGRLVPLATDFIASAAFDDSSWGLLHALQSATCDTHKLVTQAATRLIADLKKNGAAGGRHMSEMHTLQELIRRDYAASDGNPETRKQLLDVIDALLEAGVYGVDSITKAHERN